MTDQIRRVGDAQKSEPTSLGGTPADLGAELPAGMAQLVVIPERRAGRQVFRLSGSCCCGDLETYYARRGEEPVHDRPDPLVLGRRVSRDVDAGGERPTRTLRRMLSWSHQKAALTEWLSHLRRRHGPQLDLIIWDYTDFETPWEMFHLGEQRAGLDGAYLPAAWLGCAAAVARWTKVVTTADNAVPGPSEKVECAGSVLSYIADDAAMQPDRALMDSLGAAYRPSLADLIGVLDDPARTNGIGLVYVATHGHYAPDYFEFQLEGSVGISDIDGRGLAGLAGSRPLVFLNACHSARMIDAAAELGDDALVGFTEVFLRAGAGGFIGAAGAVQESAAQAVVTGLLEQIRATPEAPVARILRDIRRNVAPPTGKLPLGDDPRVAAELLPFLYTFMYLYYGSPETTLKLDDGSGRP